MRTRDREFVYLVTGSRIVRPDQSEVLANTADHRLTLTPAILATALGSV